MMGKMLRFSYAALSAPGWGSSLINEQVRAERWLHLFVDA